MTEKDPYLVILDRQTKKAESIDPGLLACRRGAQGHHWEAVAPDFETKLRGAKAVAFQCSNCYAIKRGVVSTRFGEWLDQPRTEYPDGYLVTRDPNTIGPTLSAQAVRRAFVKLLDDNLDSIVELHHEHG